MEIVKHLQGSPAWLAYRKEHFNASDSPAMMGCSSYKTRSQLLHEMHTGLAPEVDAGTQRRFDEGHRIEALARPLAEKIIGEELYPVVGSLGKLSASFDGLTMLEDIAFEHKTLNGELRAVFDDMGTISPEYREQQSGKLLPRMYRLQIEQQCFVSGCEKILFMASTWDANDVLVEEHHCWYFPDPDLRKQLVGGWEQFSADLAAYTPPEVAAAKPIGRTPETLPALRIEVTGMVTASNLQEYKEHALAVFGGINKNLETDADFATAESTVKWCADIEDRIKSAKAHALSQTASIDELFRTLDDIATESKATRLELDKLVKARKEQIRADIVKEGVLKFSEHIATQNQRLGKPYMPQITTDFPGVIKGKRTIDSLREAVNNELVRAKIAANEVADRISLNMATLRELAGEHAFLFADTAQIVLKQPDDLAALVKMRIAEHQAKEAARLESEREKIRAEEQAKAQREAQAAEQARQREEEGQRRAAEAVQAEAERMRKAQEDRELAELKKADQAAANVIPMRAAAPVAATAPTLKLGEIGERLGFSLSADFLANLGFEAVKVKNACLYQERDFPLILMRLIAHIQAVQAKQEA